MDSKKIKQILKSVKEGKTSIQDALILFKHMPYEDIGVAMTNILDAHADAGSRTAFINYFLHFDDKFD